MCLNHVVKDAQNLENFASTASGAHRFALICLSNPSPKVGENSALNSQRFAARRVALKAPDELQEEAQR